MVKTERTCDRCGKIIHDSTVIYPENERELYATIGIRPPGCLENNFIMEIDLCLDCYRKIYKEILKGK